MIAFTAAQGRESGALVLSPFARAGSTVARAAGPYALLHTVETIFRVPALGRSRHAPDLTKALFPAALEPGA
jgi:hypothetical protein